MEEHTLLRNFMEINLANVTQRKYLNLDRNPFAEEDQEKYNCEYTLKSLVSFEDKQSSDSCFLTYVKKDDQTWIKYSRTTRTEVSRKEVEAIVMRKSGLLKRIVLRSSARQRLTKLIQISIRCRQLSSRPIPDFWFKRIQHLAEPGNIQFNHFLCNHGALRPYYKDVIPKSSYHIELSRADHDNIIE